MNGKELTTVGNMKAYGNGFVRALAEALYLANTVDFQKIKDAFPEYWEHYSNYININNK